MARRKVRQETKAEKRARVARGLRALVAIPYPINSSDRWYQPQLPNEPQLVEREPAKISEAELVLDFLISGQYDRDNDVDHETDTPIEYRGRVTRSALKRVLFNHAVKIRLLEISPQKLSGFETPPPKGWLAIGVRVERVGFTGERNYHCLFCDDNVVTLGVRKRRGGRREERAATDKCFSKLHKHVAICAMRYLINPEQVGIREVA